MKRTDTAATILLTAGLVWAFLLAGCGLGDPAKRVTEGGEVGPPAAALYADHLPSEPPSGDVCRDERQRIAELQSRIGRLQVQLNTERADEQDRSRARADRYGDDDRYDSSYGTDAYDFGEDREADDDRGGFERDRRDRLDREDTTASREAARSGADGAESEGGSTGDRERAERRRGTEDGRTPGSDDRRSAGSASTGGGEEPSASGGDDRGGSGSSGRSASGDGDRVELLGQPRVEVSGDRVTVSGRIANHQPEDMVGNLVIELVFDGQVVDSATSVFQVGGERQVEYSKTFPTPPQEGELTARVRIRS